MGVDESRPVDFTDVAGTSGNCSGGVTPWGTVLTAEEKYTDRDTDGDGYGDLGWLTEIDPASGEVVGGKKCWAMGHFRHENATVLPDERTVYFGEDGGSSGVYKFIADAPRDLSSGRLFGLVLDGPLMGDEPTTNSGRWVEIPNGTIAERNATDRVATELGVTNFGGVEDVEYHPTTGQLYFAAKLPGRVYRFTDTGEEVTDVATYVGGQDYVVETQEGSHTVAWGKGNDNLVFDGEGNLWVQQDGDGGYIWVVRLGHSQERPDVAIFARTPRGSEPTGLNFTPDFRFGFFSIQHPGGDNEAQLDAAGNEVRFTASATVVFALEEDLGEIVDHSQNFVQSIPDVSVYPNPTSGEIQLDFGLTDAGTGYELELYDIYGRRLPLLREHLYVPAGGGICTVDLSGSLTGSQLVVLVIRKGEERIVRKIWVER